VLEGAGARLGAVVERGLGRHGPPAPRPGAADDDPGRESAADLASDDDADAPDVGTFYDAPDDVVVYSVRVDDLTPGGEDVD
jgi:hypothetical protein